jgi:hypothetical protein
MSLQADLGLDGADAIEFFDDFAATFDVDLSAFDFGSAFGAEAGPGPCGLVRRLFGSRGAPAKVDIKVRQLVQAAERRRWQA